MKLSIEELIMATGGQIMLNKCNFGKIGISTDSRNIKEDEIFLPLYGEKFNGHDYINNALKQGGVGYFIDKKHYDKAQNYYNPTRLIIAVEDTLEAYLKIAAYIRKKINPKVVAITGSSGKTTAKEMIFSVLAENFKTHKSQLNNNNEVGFCQTVISMPENTEFLVVEMGMRAMGEIELLSKHAEPDFAVITNVGSSHIGRLGSHENIAKAKCEIIKHLKPNGFLIAFDDELIKKTLTGQTVKTIFYGKDYQILETTENSTKFIYQDNEYKIPANGEYNVINSLAAIEIGKLAKISTKKIAQGLLKYEPVGERGKIINISLPPRHSELDSESKPLKKVEDDKGNIKIISDCYNANPDSMKASINSAIATYPNSEIILVLGDMAELGEYEDSMHKEIGKFLAEKHFSQLVTVGEKAKLIAEYAKNKNIKIKSFADNKKAADFLRKNVKENSVILLKASRCMKFEEIAESLSKCQNKPK